ncbi:MAG: M24B family metallopeptidase, partial [Pseudomonadota bacterium]
MAFQTFDPPSGDLSSGDPDGDGGDAVRARVTALRALFPGLDVDGVIIPHEDAYQSEYLPPSEERLAFVTGFTGSAGRAFVLADKALFATDGRYTLQAKTQVPGDTFEIVSKEKDETDWLKKALPGVRLGYDPNLHARRFVTRLTEMVPDVTLVPLANHPVDAIWNERPPTAPGTVRSHPASFAGRTTSEKLADIRADMETDAHVIAAADTVSWLLNWRGDDIAHTPLVLARAFVPKSGAVTVFVEPQKVPADVLAPLDGLVTLRPDSDYPEALKTLSGGLKVSADPAKVSEAALSAIEAGGTLVPGADLVDKLKAIKNGAEIEGMRRAHQRDGVAMVRFLAFCDQHAAGRTEIDLVEKLEALRREVGATDVSFDTISGSGPNGAIVHYRVDRSTNRTIAPGDPVLIDSGAQYPDGTTDITRTIVAGTPTDEFRRAFTLVLKGHIAISRQRFPEGTAGADIDGLARAALWNAGHDYAHGTGHGVGAALAVHEGPAGISKRSRVPLKAGMILSNEPGFYPGDFGIRIENLVLVSPAEVPAGGSVAMLSFETLTLAPIDTR